MSAALVLRMAVRSALLTDAGLLELLGRAAIYDEPPPTAEPPYVLLGDHLCRDASSSLSPAEEHEVTLEIWSRQQGLKQTLQIAAAVVAALNGRDLPALGQKVVAFAWLSTEARREEGDRFARIRFRALTEPA